MVFRTAQVDRQALRLSRPISMPGTLRSKFVGLAFVVAVAGCTTPSFRSTDRVSRTFSISSQRSGFSVRGELTGTLEILRTEIIIVVTAGTVVSTWGDEPAVRLRPMIAGPTQGDVAERVMEFDAQQIGGFVKDLPRAFSGPLIFRAATPAKLDLRNQWLVFEFQLENRHTTYACDIDNLTGPDPSGQKRNGLVCWASR
jgi:hypothetical protein